MNRSGRVALMAAVVIAAGCGEAGTAAGEPSWFLATTEGALVTEFRGTGDFSPQKFGVSDRYTHYNVFSSSVTPGTDDDLWILWPSNRRPRVGRYPLVPHDNVYGSSRGVVAIYGYARGDNINEIATIETYIAQSGWVEITRSTPGVMDGTVYIEAVQVHRSVGSDTERDDPRERPASDAPRIRINGSFHATFFDASKEVVHPN